MFSAVRSFFAQNSACLLAYADEDFYWEDLTKRMEPWFKPAYSPDTLLAFQYWGHFVAVRVGVLDSMSYRMVSMKDPDLGFYELCLRLEEKIEELSAGNFKRRQAAIGHLDSILYHRSYCPAEEMTRVKQDVSAEERFSVVRKQLKKELAEGRFLTGASSKYVTLKEDMLLRRGGRGVLKQGADPDIYHLIYDTSVSGRERCTRSGSENTAIAPHRVVSVIILSKDHPGPGEVPTFFKEKRSTVFMNGLWWTMAAAKKTGKRWRRCREHMVLLMFMNRCRLIFQRCAIWVKGRRRAI